ncbi:MAG TPA: hypothetical protein H9869_07980 [Candidatus Ligilactobacillus excrementipullorum]|nr:hypothetical protein [Candidatus Ligilactobacillus excrementipullorum]
MAKVVNFDGKKIGIDKEYHLLDSQRNLKKVAKHHIKILEEFNKINEDEQENSQNSILSFTKQTEIVAQVTIEATGDLLQLNKEQKDKLADYSISDMYEFFNECLTKFLGIALPDMSDDEEEPDEEIDEDPKSQDEEPSGN